MIKNSLVVVVIWLKATEEKLILVNDYCIGYKMQDNNLQSSAMLTVNWRMIYLITRIMKDKLHELIEYLFLNSFH